MKSLHLIVDYSFLYYKYYFSLLSGRVKRLTYSGDSELFSGGANERDISQLYYSIREIEGIVKEFETKYGYEVTPSICFDMPHRLRDESDGDGNYKSNRVKTLGSEDFENIRVVENLLKYAGFNTYREEGYEADDIVTQLTRDYKDKFDNTLIVTPDADLFINLDMHNKVAVKRFKSTSGYKFVNKSNFSDYVQSESSEFKKVVRIPFNSIALFKATVGDSSDNIKGISGFGGKAFDKLIVYLENKGETFENMTDINYVQKVIEEDCKGYLKDTQINDSIESLSLIRPMVVDGLEEPVKRPNNELREKSYSRLDLKSLYS